MKLAASVLIRAEPSPLWEVLSRWERQPEWMPDVVWIRPIGSDRGPGARFEARTKVFGVPLVTDRIEVVGWEPPRRLAIQHRGLVQGEGEWTLEPVAGGTRFTWREVLRMRPAGLGDAALLAYRPWQRWMLRRSLANLKRLVEREEPVEPR